MFTSVRGFSEPLVRPYIPEPEYEIPVVSSISSCSKTAQQNGSLFSEPEILDFISTIQESNAGGDGERVSDMAPLVPPTREPESKPTPFWEKFISYKYDIVLLSLFVQTLCGLSLISFDSNYFFLPVFIYIVTKLIWFPIQNSSNIANALLLLNGVSPDKVQKILSIAQCFGVISRDTFVYLFVTICVQSLWITLKNWLVT